MIAKQVHIDEERARRLEQLAVLEGITPDALIERALDLLFQAQPVWPEHSDELQADWDLLQELEAKLGPVETPSAPPIRPDEVRFVVGTQVRGQIRRLGEQSGSLETRYTARVLTANYCQPSGRGW